MRELKELIYNTCMEVVQRKFKNVYSEGCLSGFDFPVYQLVLWASYLLSLAVSFFICKMRIILVSIS